MNSQLKMIDEKQLALYKAYSKSLITHQELMIEMTNIRYFIEFLLHDKTLAKEKENDGQRYPQSSVKVLKS